IFLQARDGIRDFHVTGVQTCALPIWEVAVLLLILARHEVLEVSATPAHGRAVGLVPAVAEPGIHACVRLRLDAELRDPLDPLARSEERRVGTRGRQCWEIGSGGSKFR